MLRTHTFARIALLVILAASAAGCELVGGIFKAGVWVGAVGVVAVVLVLVFAVAKLRR